MTATVYADGRAVLCPRCHTPLVTAGETGVHRLWYLACTSNEAHLWKLNTALLNQPDPYPRRHEERAPCPG